MNIALPTRTFLLSRLAMYGATATQPVYALALDIVKVLAKCGVLDKTAKSVELAFSQFCVDKHIVGFYRDTNVQYPLFDPDLQRKVFEDLLRDYLKLKKESWKLAGVRAELKRKLPPVQLAQRAYAGWLMTNPRYQQEWNSFFARWKKRILFHGLPEVSSSGICLLGNLRDDSGPDARRAEQYLRALARFCVRWRLAGLAAPGLAVPIGPQLPVVNIDVLRWHINNGGLTIFVPDTFPVPSRDEFRQMSLLVQERRMPGHLSDWGKILRKKAGNTAGMKRFAHMLVVHHYTSILESRHQQAIVGKSKHVDAAIADHLEVKPESVRQLRLAIRKRLSAR